MCSNGLYFFQVVLQEHDELFHTIFSKYMKIIFIPLRLVEYKWWNQNLVESKNAFKNYLSQVVMHLNSLVSLWKKTIQRIYIKSWSNIYEQYLFRMPNSNTVLSVVFSVPWLEIYWEKYDSSAKNRIFGFPKSKKCKCSKN